MLFLYLEGISMAIRFHQLFELFNKFSKLVIKSIYINNILKIKFKWKKKKIMKTKLKKNKTKMSNK